MNPTETFEAERSRRVRDLAMDEELRRLSLQWMMRSSRHGYTYNFSWLGRPVIQFPQDLLAAQEIIWSTKPDLIIETGVAHGGSIVFWASILELIGAEGRVIGIDVEIRPQNRRAIEAHSLAGRITLIEGSSIEDSVMAEVRAAATTHERVMVILDSNHSHEHVLGELSAYGPLVTPGCYLVVFDTVLDDLPSGFVDSDEWDNDNNPKTAVRQFLRTSDRFEIDHDIPHKLMITVAPDGYLKCVKA